MKMRRVVAALVSAATLFATAAQASQTNPWINGAGTSEDSYDIPYSQSKAIEILAGIGIIDDEIFFKETCAEPITRIDAAKLLYNFSGYDQNGGVLSGTAVAFEDIFDTDAADILKYITGEKIMEGTSHTTFSPDIDVSYDMMCKMIASFMGYRSYAESYGGYPAGYRKAVADRKLIDTEISDSAAVTNGEFALALYNLFDKHKLVLTRTGSRDGYTTEEDDVLYSNLRIISGKGIVNATAIATVGGVYSRTSGVNIDAEEFACNNFTDQEKYDLDKLIARRIEYYYSDKDGAPYELVCYYTDDKLNTITSIPASDIDKIDSGRIYTENKNYNVYSQAGVIKNNQYTGKRFDMFEANELIPKTGHINLIDNNTDGKVDYVEVFDYLNVIVDTVNIRENKIVNKYKSADIDLSNEGMYPLISENGRISSLAAVGEWMALGVLINDSGEVTGVEISPYAAVSGAVSGIDEEKCTVNDKEYIISENYTVRTNYSIAPTNIILGEKTTLILNVEGEIIAIHTSGVSSSGILGYIVSALYDEAEGELKIKVFTQNGEMATYSTTEELKMNSTIKCEPEVAYQMMVSGRKVKPQIVKLKLGSQNQLKEICLTYDPYSASADKYENCIQRDAYYARRTWVAAQSRFEYTGTDADPSEREFYASSSTIVFGVPAVYNGSEDDGKFTVTDTSAFTTEVSYMVEAYNLDDEYNAGIIVAQLSNTAYIDANYTPIGIIVNTYETLDKNGDTATGVTIYFNGSKSKYVIASDAELKMFQYYSSSSYITFDASALKRGDAVRIAINNDGEIGALAKHLPNSPTGTLSPSIATFSIGRGAYNETTYGKVMKRSGNTFVVQALSGNKNINFIFRVNGGTNIYVYDVENDDIYKGNISDLRTAEESDSPSYVLMKALNNDLNDMVIYNY